MSCLLKKKWFPQKNCYTENNERLPTIILVVYMYWKELNGHDFSNSNVLLGHRLHLNNTIWIHQTNVTPLQIWVFSDKSKKTILRLLHNVIVDIMKSVFPTFDHSRTKNIFDNFSTYIGYSNTFFEIIAVINAHSSSRLQWLFL